MGVIHGVSLLFFGLIFCFFLGQGRSPEMIFYRVGVCVAGVFTDLGSNRRMQGFSVTHAKFFQSNLGGNAAGVRHVGGYVRRAIRPLIDRKGS